MRGCDDPWAWSPKGVEGGSRREGEEGGRPGHTRGAMGGGKRLRRQCVVRRTGRAAAADDDADHPQAADYCRRRPGLSLLRAAAAGG